MSEHIDQMKEWWDGAESDAVTRTGDTVIKRGRAGYDLYEVFSEDVGHHISEFEGCRILERAPKPKPAWHDSVAVMADASQDEEGNIHRTAFIYHVLHEQWEDGQGGEFRTWQMEHLNPVPLIPAVVTEEARDRVWNELVHHGLVDPEKTHPCRGWTADVVHAALGLETR